MLFLAYHCTSFLMLPTKKHSCYDWLAKSGLVMDLPKLTRRKISLIEQADFLLPSDKLELLGLLLHLWFTGEIKAKPDAKTKELLTQLNLAWFINSYRHCKKGLLKWTQVSVNAQINQFIKKHTNDMSPIEAGVLYNYPIPDILAYMCLIARTGKTPKTPVGHYFGKVHSHRLYQQVYQEYRRRWQLIKETSPAIYRELIQHHRPRGG
ncbi:MAG: hypothetical protein V1807_03115 [Patescibacteria group bacterium]